MSMILDAIKRSKEAHGGTGSAPCLGTEHCVAPREPIWRKAGLKSVALIALTLIVVSLALVFSPDRNESATLQKESDDVREQVSEPTRGDYGTPPPSDNAAQPRSQTSLASAMSVSAPSHQSKKAKLASGGMGITKPIVTPTETQSANSSSLNAEELSSLYAAMNEEATAALEPEAASKAETAISPKVLAPETFDRTAELSEEAEGSEEGMAVDFAEILAKAQEELGVQPLLESAEPLLETLSQQTKDQIPSLIYSEHSYLVNGRSEVVLNGQSLTERQRLGPFTVVEILPDSVILRWREIQFRVRARNSWINM